MILTRDGLSCCTGIFNDVKDTLICAEVMLYLDKSWEEWRRWDELSDEDFITSIYFSYLLLRPEDWELLLPHMNVNIKWL